MEVCLIDSPVANVANIRRALGHAGADVQLSADPAVIARAAKIVLPGVGSFAAAMEWLNSTGTAAAIHTAVSNGAALLGICVGHQVLFEDSDEDGLTPGLGLCSGSVRGFNGHLPVPQIGWNSVDHTGDVLFDGVQNGTSFYFVNSYRVVDAESEVASSEYSGRFTAAIHHDRVFGVQFHPEKSSAAGLRVLSNFVEHVQ